MIDKYIGVENELTSFRYKDKPNAHHVEDTLEYYFSRLKEPPFSQISHKKILTDTGDVFYIDGDVLEICTPPVAINQGFATRLTDLLMIGREKVIKSIPELYHTGYSMHWNLTYVNSDYKDTFYDMAVPFQLFGLTPLSVGFKLRVRGDRHEFMGDSLVKEEQINATALLLGAYLNVKEKKHNFPLAFPDFDEVKRSIPSLADEGRYSIIEVISLNGGKKRKIQAQTYIELFYEWLEPFVKALGTSEEVNNLEGFISGSKKLEFDDRKYFKYLKKNGGKRKGIYFPITTSDSGRTGQILLPDTKKREVPLEGKLFRTFIKAGMGVYWNRIWTPYGTIDGISQIYRYANKMDPELPKFVPPENLNLEPNTSLDTSASNFKKRIKYRKSRDKFKKDKIFSSRWLKKKLSRIEIR